MTTLEYAIVILVEALAVFYVARFFYKTFVESIRRENACGGSCGCGKSEMGARATKPAFKRDGPFVPPHIQAKAESARTR